MPRHIHRADLHRGLLACAEALGVESFYDSRVVDADPELPAVTTKDGRQWKADLIVASDGKWVAYI
jgi:salicylate hydroxylase